MTANSRRRVEAVEGPPATSAMLEAQAPSCPRCGAPLPLRLATDSIECAACGAPTALDDGLRHQLRAYVGNVASLVRAELEARFEAAFFDQNERAARSIIGGAVVMAIFLTGALVAASITSQFQMGVPLVYFCVLVVGWVVSLATFARGWHVMYDFPGLDELRDVQLVRCGRCGACEAVAPGQANPACSHCRSHLLVPCSVAASFLETAHTRTRRSRARREQSRSAAVFAGDRLAVIATVGVVVVVFASIGVVLGLGRIEGPELSRSTLGLSFLLPFVVAFASMWRSTRRGMARKAEFDAAIATITRRASEALA